MLELCLLPLDLDCSDARVGRIKVPKLLEYSDVNNQIVLFSSYQQCLFIRRAGWSMTVYFKAACPAHTADSNWLP